MFDNNNRIEICDNNSRFNTWHQLGLFQARRGDLDGAIRSISRAISFFDRSPQAFNNLSSYHLQKGEHDRAILAAAKAIELQPDFVDAWSSLGSAQMRLGMLDEALLSFNRGLGINPYHLDLLNNTGLVLEKKNNHALAMKYFEKVVEGDKNNYIALCNLSSSLFALGHYQDALEINRKALLMNPNYEVAFFNCSMILKRMGKYDESIEMYRKGMAKDPTNPEHLCNLAGIYFLLLKIREVIEILEFAIEMNPDHWEPRWSLGFIRLLQGDLKNGFRDCELNQRNLPRSIPTPRWQGEEIEGKTLLVRYEQGIGDCIQFMRYVPLLKRYNCKVFIEIYGSLHSLFNHLAFQLISPEEPTPKHDLQVSLMSLAYLFGTELSTILPPISINGAHRQPIKNRIGIVWNCTSGFSRSWLKSLPDLALLKPLLQIPEKHFVSLQKDTTPQERKFLEKFSVEMPPLETFTDTVRILNRCERLITIDTSVAHLAGSMGVPTSILTPYAPDWRWMLDRTDSPWYPSVRLFRQTVIDSWVEPLEEIKKCLINNVL